MLVENFSWNKWKIDGSGLIFYTLLATQYWSRCNFITIFQINFLSYFFFFLYSIYIFLIKYYDVLNTWNKQKKKKTLFKNKLVTIIFSYVITIIYGKGINQDIAIQSHSILFYVALWNAAVLINSLDMLFFRVFVKQIMKYSVSGINE
jgi:hypothetical protein